MKALSASERFKETKRFTDVTDIQVLLDKRLGSLLFLDSAMAEDNKALVKELISVLVKYGTWSEQEWLRRLGL